MKPPRDPAYLAWVRRHACIICGKGGVEAHHLDPNMARRGSDYRTIPLCREHHREGPDAIHVLGKVKFQERFGQVWNTLDQVAQILVEHWIEQEGTLSYSRASIPRSMPKSYPWLRQLEAA